jgi:hypothetical protein
VNEGGPDGRQEGMRPAPKANGRRRRPAHRDEDRTEPSNLRAVHPYALHACLSKYSAIEYIVAQAQRYFL